MCTSSIVYLTLLVIIRAFGEYINNGENCVSVSIWQGRGGILECRENKTVYIEQIMLGTTNTCKYNRSNTRLASRKESKITCSNKSQCIVIYNRNFGSAVYKYMNLRFQCLDCLPMYSGYPAVINCPAKSVLRIKDIWYNDTKCPAFEYDSSNRRLAYYRNICEHSFQCTIPNNNAHKKTGSIYYYCKVDERTTNCQGEPNYAAIAGGIVGILIVICITVGVFLLRKRNCCKWGNGQRSRTETDDASNGQPTTSYHQQTQLINSSAAIQVSTSHSVNVDDTTNERSNAYSHIRNIVDDSDVMYDHTVHHAVHSTCDGDYGIAHRRITEDDYDVSGNYHQSFTNKTDPVYN